MVPIKNFTFTGDKIILTSIDDKDYELMIEDDGNSTNLRLVVVESKPKELTYGLPILQVSQ
jgi:hypothetical protein